MSLQVQAAQAVKTLPTETPAKFAPVLDEFDFTKREVMIPMRDGVKLKTFILIPKGARSAPIIMTRTPYNAGNRIARYNSSHLAAVVPQMNDTTAAAGYIIVYQDVRGKFGSEGDYVLTRPLRGPLNPT
ncbi:MAG: CocE/NonD family hydrolase, partial [Steroidobacter sp.]